MDWQNVNLVNDNIWAFDLSLKLLKEENLHYPTKVICFGLFLVKSGEAELNIDFQKIHLVKNDILHLFPNNVLEFKKLSDDCQIKAVVVSIDYFSQLNLELTSQQAFDILSNNYSKLISLSPSICATISYNIKRIQRLNDPNDTRFFNTEMLKLYFSLIMYDLANFTQNQLRSNNFKSIRKEDIAIQFAAMVVQNFRSRKDVQYYADLLFITRTHLTRTIKDVFQKTPKEIIEDRIIAEAKTLLLKNDLSISQIMEDLKYNDQAAFTKFFKKKAGVTPHQYRKR
ncbi:helix-turn-helix domain-containing protein [Chryseobacterium sp. Ch-15]|nr:helix-turn-helix domain-containing protein [Chryseobacterium muglaense]MCC9036129.1 helix-turn-helix domain-containing protein [Chryseobacterium muglaense]MCM2553295.1 helix-turn-helix domain-containing protein [Chryseobacterium muglaense]